MPCLQTGLFWKKKNTKGKKSISDGQSHMSKIGGNCQGVQT